MGRPREFDEDQAVAAAAEVFRRRGYAATSVEHLVAATGVHRGSLYGTFGSKHGLLLRTLEAAAGPRETSEGRLDLCLVALIELAPADERVRERVAAVLDERGITASGLGTRLLARARLDHDENGDSR